MNERITDSLKDTFTFEMAVRPLYIYFDAAGSV